MLFVLTQLGLENDQPSVLLSLAEDGKEVPLPGNHDPPNWEVDPNESSIDLDDIDSSEPVIGERLVTETMGSAACTLEELKSIESLTKNMTPIAARFLSKLMKFLDAFPDTAQKSIRTAKEFTQASLVTSKKPENFFIHRANLMRHLKANWKKIKWTVSMGKDANIFKEHISWYQLLIDIAWNHSAYSQLVATSSIPTEGQCSPNIGSVSNSERISNNHKIRELAHLPLQRESTD